MAALRELLKKCVPELSSGFHKGQAGKVAVVGGSLEYTGAPYYSGISALKAGADLAYIFCVKDAATAIKSYTPELIVHPLLECSGSRDPSKSKAETIAAAVREVLKKATCMIAGPGLGRDSLVSATVAELLSNQPRQEPPMPVVLDGDALSVAASNLDLVRGKTHVVLTPNVNEFDRLWQAAFGEEPRSSEQAAEHAPERSCAVPPDHPLARDASRLAAQLGHVTVVQKGSVDVITDGRCAVLCVDRGSLRRAGGQGDILTGLLGTFLSWTAAADDSSPLYEAIKAANLSRSVVAAAAACTLNRHAACAAFAKHHRGMTAPDVIDEIGPTFYRLFDERA